jgi:hypothetical protein
MEVRGAKIPPLWGIFGSSSLHQDVKFTVHACSKIIAILIMIDVDAVNAEDPASIERITIWTFTGEFTTHGDGVVALSTFI